MKLSSIEIKSFLKSIGISQLEKPSLEYLNIIILKITENIPWQNISMLNAGLGKVPSLEDVKLKMLEGIGGICLDINRFLFYFLKELGYDVHYILCGREGEIEKRHIALNVYINNEPFFVDCGDTQAYFEALRLKSNRPLKKQIYQYKIEQQDNLDYKNYIKIEDSDWKVLYVFNLQKYSEHQLSAMIRNYYCDIDYSIFWKNIYFSIYQDKKINYIKGNSCFYQDDYGKLQKMKDLSFSEIKKIIYLNVDNRILNKLDFDKAIKNLNDIRNN